MIHELTPAIGLQQALITASLKMIQLTVSEKNQEST